MSCLTNITVDDKLTMNWWWWYINASYTFEEHVQRNETVSKAYLEPTMLNDNDMAQWYTAKQARKWLNDECCTTVGSVIRRANCMFMHFMLMC